MTTPSLHIDQLTRPAELSVPQADGAVRCLACAHRCLVRPGRRGVCQVRFNDGGVLRAPWGYVAALQADPVEKKPFSHVTPGALALTFGMLGCDFHCDYCQNWFTSQTLRDPASHNALFLAREISPSGLVDAALRVGARLIVSSYNEPLITTEWAVSVFQAARSAGLLTAFVSNGNATPEALNYLLPHLDAYKVDLKSMRDKNYRKLGGALKNVLTTIEQLHARGIWLEVVTLIVPDFNDSVEELWDAARFLAGVSPDIPWHVTAFHPDYRMNDRAYTAAETLQLAADIGREAGLNFVYAGNLPGQVGEQENTICRRCNATLIERTGYRVRANHLRAGKCPSCGDTVPGRWE
jgi:pyruvate formate lyase activating enzyme